MTATPSDVPDPRQHGRKDRHPGKSRHPVAERTRSESNHADQTNQARQCPEGRGEVLVQHAYSTGRSGRIARASTDTLVLSAACRHAATRVKAQLAARGQICSPSARAAKSVAALSFDWAIHR